MKMPATAFAWEFQKRVCRPLFYVLLIITGLVLSAIGGLGIRYLEPAVRESIIERGYFVALWSQILAYTLTLLFLQSDRVHSGRYLRFPSRMFSYPMRTDSLIAWQIILGALAIILCTIATSVTVSLIIKVNLPILSQLLFAMSVYTVCLAIAWFPVWLPVRLMAAYLILQQIACWLSSHYSRLWSGFGWSEYITLSSWIVGAYLLAKMGVSMDRCGRFWGIPKISGFRLSQIPRNKKHGTAAQPFRSPKQAQLWFEMRSKWWLLSVIVGSVLLVELVLNAFGVIEEREIAYFLIGTGCFLMPFGAWYMGFVLGGSRTRIGKLKTGSFIATRPMSPTLLVSSILKTGVLNILIAWGLFTFIMAISGTTSNYQDVTSNIFGAQFDQSQILGITLLASFLVFCITWASLSITTTAALSNRRGVIALFICLPIFLFIFRSAIQVYGEDFSDQIEFLGQVLCWVVGFGMLITGVWSFVSARRLKLISQPAIVMSICIWVIIMATWISLAGMFNFNEFTPAILILLVGLSAIPAIPIALAPLVLNWDWHR